MISEKLLCSLLPLREEEKICKQYYEIYRKAEDPEQLAAFRRALPPDPKRDFIFDYMEAEFSEPFTMREEPVNFPTSEEAVCVDPHTRYSAAHAHTHYFYEMIYVLHGFCDNVIEGKCLKMLPGDLCIMTPGTVHSMHVFRDDSIVINFLIRRSTFNETFLGTLPKDSFLSMYFMRAQYYGNPSKYILFHIQEDETVQQILELMIWQGLKKDQISNYLKNDLLRLTFAYLLRNQQNVEISEGNAAESPHTMAILSYIYENYATVTRLDLSARFHFSETHITRLILQSTGTTLTNLLRTIRLSKACTLLTETDLEVQKISETVGYESPEHFHRIFKQSKKMPPLKYRQLYKK